MNNHITHSVALLPHAVIASLLLTFAPPLPAATVSVTNVDYVVLERGLHHKQWARVERFRDAKGKTVSVTNVAYIELATGMHYTDPQTGKLIESKEIIEPIAGGAIARQGQHRILFPNDLTSSIQLQTPDSKTMVSKIRGLSYYDSATDQHVLLAEVQPCQGIISGNQVLYTNAMTNIRCSVRYTYTKGGFEQDVILPDPGSLPTPESLGLSSDSTRLVVLTEFINPPQATKEVETVRTNSSDVADETLNFGVMDIRGGRAFTLGTNTPQKEIRIFKQWVKLDGRDFLAEQVTVPDFFRAITAMARNQGAANMSTNTSELASLSGNSKQVFSLSSTGGEGRGEDAFSRNSSRVGLPNFLIAPLFSPSNSGGDLRPSKSAMQVFSLSSTLAAPKQREGGRQSIAATRRLPSLRAEAATKNKEPKEQAHRMFEHTPERNSNDSKAMEIATIQLPEEGIILDYNQVVTTNTFTFEADKTYYCSSAVTLSGTITFEGNSVIKFSNAPAAISLSSATVVCSGGPYRMVVVTSKNDDSVGQMISDSTHSPDNVNGATFINTGNSDKTFKYFRFSYAGTAIKGKNFKNIWHCQFYRCAKGIDYGSSGYEGNLYNVLFAKCNTALYSAGINLRAEHVTAEASGITGAVFNYDTSDAVTAVNSIFSSCPISGNPTLDSCENNTGWTTFATKGAASYYISSPVTGSANINTTLLNDLKAKTVVAPTFQTGNILTEILISRAANMRDTGSSPIRGYHYDPIDYIVLTGRTISGILTLKDGVVLATYGTGYTINAGGQLISEGSPTAMNWFVRYNTVQEPSNPATSTGIAITTASSSAVVNCKFTAWSAIGSADHFYSQDQASSHRFTDCQFNSGNFTTYSSAAFTNCLFRRVYVTLQGDTQQSPLSYYVYNNLFRGGTFYYAINGWGSGRAYDNLFDRTTIERASTDSDYFSHDYNGYVSGFSRLEPPYALHDQIITTTDYQSGSLGEFYYNVSGANNLSTLINSGSRPAAAAALYHHTVKTSNQKEADDTSSAQVDIGFHYVALDGSGNPKDYDSDGSPDYLEDKNRNGDLDTGETEWRPTLTVTADNKTREYGLANPAFTHTVSGFVYNENSSVIGGAPSLTTSAAIGSPVSGSPYTINTALGTLSAPNYKLNLVNGNLTLTRAYLSVVARDQTKHVGEPNPNPAGDVIGIRNNDPITASYSTPATQSSPEGEYPVIPTWDSTPNILALLPNYIESRVNGTLTVVSDDSDNDGMSDTWEISKFGNLSHTGTADTDYDGRSDLQEFLDGTDPTNVADVRQVLLGHWTLDKNDWKGEQGQSPLNIIPDSTTQLVPARTGNGLQVNSTTHTSLKFRHVEANGAANINLRAGTVRFWFKPGWNSAPSSPSGPGAPATLLMMGSVSPKQFSIDINSTGDQLSFTCGNTTSTWSINWNSTTWYQIVVAYSPSGSQLYINGSQKTPAGATIPTYPSLSPPAKLSLGGDNIDGSPANGIFDELETFNYPLSQQSILDAYTAVTSAAQASSCDLYPIALHANAIAGRTPNVTFPLYDTGSPGNFGWLDWNGGNSPEWELGKNLTPPGTSRDQQFGYINPDNANDKVISPGDWISGATGKKVGSSVDTALALLKNQPSIVVPIWDQVTGNGSHAKYHVPNTGVSFAKVKVVSYNLTTNPKRIDFQYIGAATCSGGQVPLPPAVQFSIPSVNYISGSAAQILDPGFSANDPDTQYLNGGQLIVDFAGGGYSEDQLNLAHQGTGANQVGISGQYVSYANNVIGTFTPGSGNTPLIVTFNNLATPAMAAAVGRRLAYWNSSASPTGTGRTVRAVLSDGTGGISAPTAMAVLFTIVLPVTVSDKNYSVNQDATLTVAAPGVLAGASAPGAGALTAGLVSGQGPSHGTLSPSSTINANGSFTYSPSSGFVGIDSFKYFAHDPSGIYRDGIANVTITVNRVGACATRDISAVVFDSPQTPATVIGGQILKGHVNLAAAAPPGGQTIRLVSSLPSQAILDSSVFVPAGSTASADFKIQTLQVAADTTVTITASYPGQNGSSGNAVIKPSPNAGDTPTSPSGFKYSVFATGFVPYPVQDGDIGPIGVAKNNRGQVLVTAPLETDKNLYIFPSDQDDQNLASAAVKAFKRASGPYIVPQGLARSGRQIYAAYDGILERGGIAELSDDIADLLDPYEGVRRIPIPGSYEPGDPPSGLLGLAVNPQNGHLLASDHNAAKIYELDPVSGSYSTVVDDETPGHDFDGVSVSLDGKTVYVALTDGYGDHFINGYDISSGASVFSVKVTQSDASGNIVSGLADGTAMGQGGTIAGKLYANCNDGQLLELDLETGQSTVLVQSQGTGQRGDFVSPDSDGSLFVTLSDRILRLTPPPGTAFGAIGSTIATRNDLANSAYASPITAGNAAGVALSAQKAVFDLRGLSGDLQAATIGRSDWISYISAGPIDLELGYQIWSGQTPLPPSYASPIRYLASAAPGSSLAASASWSLSGSALLDLQQALGGNHAAYLINRVSTACGAFSLTDTPQSPWPQSSNSLTLLIKGVTNPQIPQGHCLDISMPAPSEASTFSGDWQIVLDGAIVASSSDPNGWNVEDDHNTPGTAFNGVIVSVPASAAVALGYQLNFAASHSSTGYFDVVPDGSIERAPMLRPLVLSATPVAANSSLIATVSLDSPAPPLGATVLLTPSSGAPVSLPASVAIPGGSTSADVPVIVTGAASPGGSATITASYNGLRQAVLRFKAATGSPPLAAPTAPSASGGAGVVITSWTAPANPTPAQFLTFNVKRSRQHGGPYTTVASGLTAISFRDLTVISGLTYYYVVSAANEFGEGPVSSEVSATPSLGTVTTPTLSFDSPKQLVSISSTPGAFIHYTLDGSEPTDGSPIYKGPFLLVVSSTVKAKAFKFGYTPSNVASATYSINRTLPPVTIICTSGYLVDQTLPDILSASGSLPDRADASWVAGQGQGYYASHYSLGNLTAGSTLVITMISPELDGKLYIISAADGLIKASNDDYRSGSGDAKVTFTAPSTGTYYVEATTATAGQSGKFKLFLDCYTEQPPIVAHGDDGGDIANNQTFNFNETSAYLGTVLTHTLWLRNAGARPDPGELHPARGLNIQSVVASGDFVVTPLSISELAPDENNQLDPERTFKITVQLPVTSYGAKTGKLTITSDGTPNPYVINFSANIQPPAPDHPTVSLVKPYPNGSTQPDPALVIVEASANSASSTIAKVEFFAAPSSSPTAFVKIGTATTVDPVTSEYRATWTGITPGTYYLMAKATDAAGNTADTTATPWLVTVAGSTGTPVPGAPSISPGDGSPYSGSVSVSLSKSTLPEAALMEYRIGTSAQWYRYVGPFVLSYNDAGGAPITVHARGFEPGVGLSAEAPTKTYTITAASTQPAPVAEVTLPLEGDVITSPTDVIGTAAPGANGTSISWRLEYQSPPVTGDWITFSNSTAAVTGSKLATFDPTLLLNGTYLIRLTAFNGTGNSVQYPPVTVIVQGEQKIGNFNLSFVDMSLPIAGIPIEVTRTYDSRDKGAGDFGMGWRLGLSNVRIQKTGTLGSGWDAVPAGPFGAGSELLPVPGQPHIISVTFPDDQVFSFEAVLDPSFQSYYSIGGGTVLFKPSLTTGRKASLAAVGNNFVTVEPAPTVNDPDAVVFINSADNLYDGFTDPVNEYQLTTRDGRVFTLSLTDGLKSVTDLNGNVVTFQPDGIYKSKATDPNNVTRLITFVRGSQNRITKIYTTADGDVAGKRLQYSYDANNNLQSFTDRSSHTTTFSYDNQHNLIDVIAPPIAPAAAGNHGVRNAYDDKGRLVQTVDANNNITRYEHLPNHVERVTDPAGRTTTIQYDANGNITQKDQTLLVNGQPVTVTSKTEFEDPDNPHRPTKITDPLNRVTFNSYSLEGNLVSTTDPLGHTATLTHNAYGQVTSVTDPSGKIILDNEYDTQGNLTQSTDANGAESYATYNADGTISTSKDALGRLTQYGYGGTVDILDPASGNSVTVNADPNGTGQPTTIIDAKNHATHVVYDNNGRATHSVTTRTLNSGVVETIDTLNEYDENVRLLKTTVYAKIPGQALQSQLQVENFYNEVGQLKWSKDYTGQQTTYSYDPAGRLISTTTPDGNSQSTEYHPDGRIASTTLTASNGKQLTTRYVYDTLGRQIGTVLPDSSSTSQEYDLAGQLVTSTDANGHSTHYHYDDAGRMLAVTDPLGRSSTSEYNEIGQKVTQIDANLNRTDFEYSKAGQLVTTKQVDGTTVTAVSVAHNLPGQKLIETDQAGVKTAYGYDELGRLTSVTNALETSDEAVTRYEYDELGHLTKQFDANHLSDQVATVFDYDFLGRRTKRTLPDGSYAQTTYSIVANKLRVQQTDFDAVNRHTTTIDYDVMGRELSRTPDAGLPAAAKVPVVFTYDPATGKRATMSDASGATSYTYDDVGRLTQKSHSVVGALNYTYDLAGNLLTIKSSHFASQGGVSLIYHWDDLNRLKQVDDQIDSTTTKSTTYEYDKVGNLQSFTYPTTTPVTTTYHYNTLNRLTDMSVAASATLATFNYNPTETGRTLGPAGNRRAAREYINSAGGINRAVNYDYDNLYRLTKEDILSSGMTPPVGTIDYGPQSGSPSTTGYDKVGNRRSRTVSLSPAVTGFGATTATFDVNDRLSTASYDPNGNTWFETLPLQPRSRPAVSPDVNHKDQYDFENHLISRSDSSSTVQIIYDGDGNRVKKVVTGPNAETRYYLVDDLNPSGYAQVVEELIPVSGNLQVTRVYAHGHNLISQHLRNGSAWDVYYYSYDGHGNVRFLVNAAGAITDTYIYDAFGIVLASTGSTANNYMFAGEQFDFDLGTYYLRARYVNPNSGRFWTMDRNEGQGSDPLSLHKYLYCSANPVNRSDPSGEMSAGEVMVVGAIIGAVQGVVTTAISKGKHTAGQYLASAFSGGIIGAATAGIGTWFWEMGVAGRILLGTFGATAGIMNTELALQNGDRTLAKYHLVTTVIATGLFISGDVLISRISLGRTPKFTYADVEAAISRLEAKGLKPSEFQTHLDPENVIALAELMDTGGFDPALMSDPIIFETSSKSYIGGHHRIIAAEMTGRQLPQKNLDMPGTRAGDWSKVQRIPGRRLFQEGKDQQQ